MQDLESRPADGVALGPTGFRALFKSSISAPRSLAAILRFAGETAWEMGYGEVQKGPLPVHSRCWMRRRVIW